MANKPKPQQHLPRPKSPPRLHQHPRSWLWKKGSAAVPGRSTTSDICSNKGPNSFDCCGLLGLPEIVWWVCVVCVPMGTPWCKVPGLCWAGVCECVHQNILPWAAAVLLQPLESRRLSLRNLGDTSVISERGKELGYEMKAEDRIRAAGTKG